MILHPKWVQQSLRPHPFRVQNLDWHTKSPGRCPELSRIAPSVRLKPRFKLGDLCGALNLYSKFHGTSVQNRALHYNLRAAPIDPNAELLGLRN
jgi:hypothetical protein